MYSKHPQVIRFWLETFEQFLCDVVCADPELLGVDGSQNDAVMETKKLAETTLQSFYRYTENTLAELRSNASERKPVILLHYLDRLISYHRMQWHSVSLVIHEVYYQLLEAVLRSPFGSRDAKQRARKDLSETYGLNEEQISAIENKDSSQ